MWLGTDVAYDAFKFFIAETEHGVFQGHAYPYSDTMSTFIVETHEDVWRRAGLDRLTPGPLPPGRSDTASVEFCSELFSSALEGRALITNNSKWITFTTVRNRSWSAGERRPARGRGPHRALLDRVGDEAGDGGRRRPGVGVQDLR